jgi:hypothetical protein
MSRKYIVFGILAVALAGLLVYVYGGSQAPPGQPPLASLTPQNVAEIRNSFNTAKDDVRVLVLLSPT